MLNKCLLKAQHLEINCITISHLHLLHLFIQSGLIFSTWETWLCIIIPDHGKNKYLKCMHLHWWFQLHRSLPICVYMYFYSDWHAHILFSFSMNLEAAAVSPLNQTSACVNSLEVIFENLFYELFKSCFA